MPLWRKLPKRQTRGNGLPSVRGRQRGNAHRSWDPKLLNTHEQTKRSKSLCKVGHEEEITRPIQLRPRHGRREKGKVKWPGKVSRTKPTQKNRKRMSQQMES